MTNIVFPSPGRGAVPDEWAAISRFGHGNSDGWVVEGERLVESRFDDDIDDGVFDAFDISTDSSSLTVSVETGEALVSGRYVARDTQTDLTLDADTTTTIVVGFDEQVRDGVVVDEAGAPDVELVLWDVTTDGSGVTDVADRRLIGPTDPTPSGVISMWSGAIDDIPVGWSLCDGTNGTPDLTDRFVTAAGGRYNVGETGGTDEHSLTEAEIPSHDHDSGSISADAEGDHTHTYQSTWDNLEEGDSANETDLVGNIGFDASTSPTERDTGAAGSHSHAISGSTGSAGGGQPHENRPPFYALAFIQKL